MNKSQKCLQQWRDIDRKSYVSLSKIHLKFLDLVTKHPCLIEGEHLRNAIRRYECYWLPLCKKHGTMSCEEWAAPLDVAWVWYLHMITPSNYVTDCIRVIGNAPSHVLKTGEAKQESLERAKELWNEAYGSSKEPFEVDLSAPVKTQSYKQKLPHDFYRLSQKQRNFHYQVSLPHFRDDAFLNAATERYVTHLDLQMKNTSVCLSLPVDVQLIMQTHQLNPIFYRHQISAILGKIANCEDVYPMESEAIIHRRHKEETRTKALWKNAGKNYCKPGTVYRGDLPACTEKIEPKNYGIPIEYDVSVTKIELIPVEYYNNYALLFEVTKGNETSKTKIKIEQGFASKHRNNDDTGPEYIQLKELSSESHRKTKSKVDGFNKSQRYSLLDEDASQESNDNDVLVIGDGNHALMHYITNVAHSTDVQVSLFEVDNNKLKTAKSCIGKCHLDVLKFVGSEDDINSKGRNQKICLPLEFTSGCPDVRLTVTLVPIGFGHHVYQVEPADYGFAKFQHITKAVPFPTFMVPLSVLTSPDVPTDVMTYPIKDYRGKETFSCRVIRTGPGLFYAVDIIDKDGKTRATGSLLSNDALPHKKHLSSHQGNAFFLPEENQYAMLIRGQEDWGICFGQQLKLSSTGSFFGLKLFLLHEKANCYCYVHKYRSSLYMFTLPSTLNNNDDSAYIYLHLAEGKVVITGNLKQIPEVLAFLISALILRYIFCEKHEDCWAMIDREGMDLLSLFQSSDDVGLFWDGVYEGDKTSTATYRAVVSNVEC